MNTIELIMTTQEIIKVQKGKLKWYKDKSVSKDYLVLNRVFPKVFVDKWYDSI